MCKIFSPTDLLTAKHKRESRKGSITRRNLVDDSSEDSPTRITTGTPTANASHHLNIYKNLIFQITWPGEEEEHCCIWLVASNLQEKEAWCSDISQVGLNCQSQRLGYHSE